MLEWETAAEAEAASRPKSTVDMYLEWTPWIALGLTALIWPRPSRSLAVGPSGAGAVDAFGPFSSWLNRRPAAGHCNLQRRRDAVVARIGGPHLAILP